MNTDLEIAVVAILTCVLLLWLVLLLLYRKVRTELSNARGHLRAWSDQYKTIQFYTVKRGNVRLQSLDGGLTWYQTWWNSETGEISVGDKVPRHEVNEIQRERAAMQALGDFVTKNGPIDPRDPRGLSILNSAGFTVTTKKADS